MTTLQKYTIALAVAVLVLIASLFVASMTGNSSSETTVNAPPRGMVVYTEGNIKNHHHRERTKRVASRSTGPCYVTTRDEYGDSGTFTEVVRGSVHFHYCVSRNDSSRLAYFNANFDHWEWWLQRWHLSWDKVAKTGSGTSSTWCTSNGSGPCFPVEYKFLEWCFEFKRHVHIPFIGDVDQFATFYINCTVRGNAPGVTANHECYSGWIH